MVRRDDHVERRVFVLVRVISLQLALVLGCSKAILEHADEILVKWLLALLIDRRLVQFAQLLSVLVLQLLSEGILAVFALRRGKLCHIGPFPETLREEKAFQNRLNWRVRDEIQLDLLTTVV